MNLKILFSKKEVCDVGDWPKAFDNENSKKREVRFELQNTMFLHGLTTKKGLAFESCRDTYYTEIAEFGN